eukprot:TRINITY_DN5023_c0_g1_i1.p1 TRINITY_DN5023_c0_g1~~TRINITY_DN5023_c0_g1_i1.p1  ORF type:complete len:350 (+),score=96.54 TRINITY_DN5023_c0_g1_i1:33-1052(+)
MSGNGSSPCETSVLNGPIELTEEQVSLVEQLKQQLDKDVITNRHKAFCTDACYRRFLVARQWKLDDARVMLQDTLKWRDEYKPDLITAEDVMIEMQNKGKMYISPGRDKYGRVVIMMKPKHDNTGKEHSIVKVKYLVYLLEKAIESMPENVEKMVWVVDWRDYNMFSGIGLMKCNMEILNILQNHYPERLGLAYLMFAPWTFSAFWKIISPFIDPETKKKVVMVDSKKNLHLLTDVVPAENVEIDYSGSMEFDYNPDEHWKAYPADSEYDDERPTEAEEGMEEEVEDTRSVDYEDSSSDKEEENLSEANVSDVDATTKKKRKKKKRAKKTTTAEVDHDS